MYHCKIASTQREYEEIARLNYATFVEEIPQHTPNAERMLVDKFHHDNTYIVIYKEQELIGMLAFRDIRPFSIDDKIGRVENFLPKDVCQKLCEIRLLAIKKQYRVGRVFLRLAQALYTYVVGEHYSACVISGITNQESLYRQIGFEQFADAVGTVDARYLPMVLTNELGQRFYRQFQKKHRLFFPGPVQQQRELEATTISHRSGVFEDMKKQVSQQLLALSRANYVALCNGSGTLANDMMLQQVQARHRTQRGLICSNGEFGKRLIKQAQAIDLQFDVYEEPWGQPFQAQQLQQAVQHASWCVVVHGETSSGTLNDLSLFTQLKQQYGFTLAVDCISSFGAVSFSMEQLDIVTATSGKALGALAGLSFVFYQQQPIAYGTAYTDVTNYHGRTPFTLPAYLVANVQHALEQYPARYAELQLRLEKLLQQTTIQCHTTTHYPTIVSYNVTEAFIRDAKLNGFELHAHSDYLQQQKIAQISTIQPTFYEDIEAFEEWLTIYQQVAD